MTLYSLRFAKARHAEAQDSCDSLPLAGQPGLNSK